MTEVILIRQLPSHVTLLPTFSTGDDISSIQQEITMMKECKHKNIVAYFGSYHRCCLLESSGTPGSFFSARADACGGKCCIP